MVEQKEKPIMEKERKGVIYQKKLDTIKTYLDVAMMSETVNTIAIDMSMLEIRSFIEQIPEKSDAEKGFEEMANPLREEYEEQKKQLKDLEECGQYLESRDAIRAKPILKYQYANKLYYVLKNIYDTYRLYEDTAIVDYEL